MSETDTDWFNYLAGCLSILGLAILSFLAGAAVVEFQLFPYGAVLERPFQALRANMEKATHDHSPKGSIWWKKVDHDKRGVTKNKKGEAFEGYTAYQTIGSKAFLIDMEGNRLHEWEMPFHEAWPDPPHIDDPVEEESIKWSGAHVFPNGDVLANYTANGDTPYGYGLIKLDVDSNIIWKYSDHVHHDFTVGDDGSIWTITHDFRDLSSAPVPTMPDKFRNERILEDFAVKLSPSGEEIRRIPLTEAVLDSPLGSKLGKWHNGAKWDLLHANNVEPIPADFARHHDFAEPGQLLLSFRELNTIALVDQESEKVTWFQRGFWVKQHDPDPLPNGNILIFDNLGYNGPGGRSRVAEYNPENGEIVWSYTGDKEEKFFTKWGGKQTMLPNQNVLISENLRSRLFEVNRDGEIVWEFFVPMRAEEEGQSFVPTLSGGHRRIGKGELPFIE